MTGTASPRGGIKPWYRHYWAWFIAMPPLAAVIAGLGTVVIATRNAPALVVDDYRRIGIANHLDMERDLQAARHKLTAGLQFADGDLVLSLSAAQNPDLVMPGTLKLLLTHPTFPDQDFEVVLEHQSDGLYRTPAPAMALTAYRLRVLPPDTSWQLVGRWLGPTAISPLNPGVNAD